MSDEPNRQPLIEGEDFYWEDACVVFTARYLARRGYCCENGCRHCPYNFRKGEREDEVAEEQQTR